MGLDFERDIKITHQDIEIQNRLRRERRPLTMDEYLAFLKFSQELFGKTQTESPPKKHPAKPFEL